LLAVIPKKEVWWLRVGGSVVLVLGAVTITFFSEWLRYLEEVIKVDIRLVVYGFVLILTILFMREGLAGVLLRLMDRFRGDRPVSKGERNQ